MSTGRYSLEKVSIFLSVILQHVPFVKICLFDKWKGKKINGLDLLVVAYWWAIDLEDRMLSHIT